MTMVQKMSIYRHHLAYCKAVIVADKSSLHVACVNEDNSCQSLLTMRAGCWADRRRLGVSARPQTNNDAYLRTTCPKFVSRTQNKQLPELCQ